MPRARHLAIAALALAVAGGCANRKTQHQQANANWNHARASVLMSLATDQFNGGTFDKCAETLGEIRKLQEKSVAVELLDARLNIELARLDRAQACLAAAGAIDPSNPEVDYLSGVIEQRWQRPDRAFDAYARASDKKPDELAYFLAQAEMLVAMNRSADALSLLLSKVVFFEHSAGIRDAVAQLQEQQGDLPAAIESYRQASVLDVQDLGIRERLALALYRGSRFREARTTIHRLLQEAAYTERGDLWIALGESQLQENAPVEARQSFEAATRVDAANPQAWLGLAKASIKLNDERRLLLSTSRAAALAPLDPQPHLLVGMYRMQQNRLNDALSAFSKASSLAPDDSLCLCMIGRVYELSGKGETALEYYGKAVRANPKDSLAQQLMAAVELND